jgi:uncharacterized phage protein (TIGR01671 family)
MKYRTWYDLARYGWIQHEYWDDFIFMQFTGLKDKNDKEIYEGDIVQEAEVGDVIWDGDGVIKECPVGIVEWVSSGYNLRQIKTGLVDLKDGGKSQLHLDAYDGQYQWDGGDLKVIGNIYENPGLVNENEDIES